MNPYGKLFPTPLGAAILAVIFLAGIGALGYGIWSAAQWLITHVSISLV